MIVRKWLTFLLAMLLAVLCGCGKPQETLPSSTAIPPTSATLHTHTYALTVVEPTCTQAGCTVHVCACGEAYVTDTLQPNGHILSPWQTVQEPTSETEGLRRRHCTGCDLTEEASIAIAPLGHSHTYTQTITPATCLQPGYTSFACSCGDQYRDQETPALGHSFAEYKSNADATCMQDGTMTAVCDRCGQEDVQIDVGSATGHQYTQNQVPPTCQSEGYTRYSCSCGDRYDGDRMEKTDHVWGGWVTIREPSAAEEGIQRRQCDDCDAVEERTVEYQPVETKPDLPAELRVISWSETIGRNETASVTIQGKPGVEYDIDVHYKSGVSTAKGLENQVADEDGYVTWTWKIGNRTAAGTFQIVITGGGETITIEFTVVV